MNRLAKTETKTQSSVPRVEKITLTNPLSERTSTRQRAQGGRLGNTQTTFPVSKKRRERYAMRAELWGLTSLKAVRKCGRVPIGPRVSLRASEGGYAGFGGLATCGSWSVCPVCSAKIARARKTEVQTVVDQAISQGKHVSMLTLTMRHHKRQGLTKLWDGMSKAWNAVTSGRQWQDFREQLGLIGYIRAAEVTHGANGWHVHSHILIISDQDPTTTLLTHQRKQGRRKTPYPLTVETPADFIAGRWSKKLAQLGIDFIKDSGGLDWQTAKDAKAIGNYVAKIGSASGGDRISSEVTLGGFKTAKRGNRTPFQILADFLATGDLDLLKVWHTWEKAAKGRRSLSWSKGLRDWADLGREKSDEEIAEEETGGEVVALIDPAEWKKIIKIGSVKLLEVTEQRGASAALEWLHRHKIKFSIPIPDLE